MDKEMKAKYDRGRRILNEINIVLDNYQKLQFYLHSGDCNEKDVDILTDQSLAMMDYLDILIHRIATTAY